jgi:hypothetical protein
LTNNGKSGKLKTINLNMKMSAASIEYFLLTNYPDFEGTAHLLYRGF